MSIKVFFGIQATGNGHITRARALVPKLKQADADVTCLFSGRAPSKLFDMEVFDPYLVRRGLTMITEKGKVSYLKTAFNSQALSVLPEILALDLKPYDVVLSDYEPVTAYAGKRQGKKTIGINHQSAFQYDIPGVNRGGFASFVINHYAPVTTGLGLHWDSFGHPILPPLIDAQTPSAESDPKKIVVYLDFEQIGQVVRFLEPFKDYRFHIYSSQVKDAEERGNAILRPLSVKGFRSDIASCAGVICGAGFELPSELLDMGKKILVKPLLGQPEQMSNARALQQLGYGDRMDTLDRGLTTRWLDRDVCTRLSFPDVAGTVAAWIAKGGGGPVRPMVDELWHDTQRSLCPVPK